MSEQRETTLVGKPFDYLLKSRGWTVDNIHGNQYQRGLPDRYISHEQYAPRWIEYKVFDSYGRIKLTRAQKNHFPVLLNNNVPIFIIAAYDLRGEEFYSLRIRLYNKLFKEENAHFAFDPMLHKLLA